MNMDDSSRKKPPVHNNLRYYREKIGATQKEMEWRTSIGAKHWPHYEAGREPKVKLAQVFARVFNEIVSEKELNIKKLTVDDLYPD